MRVNTPNAGMIAAGGHDDGYLVEKIVGHRKSRGRQPRVSFKVKWLGYPESENTWEPMENLKPVAHLLQDYVESKNLDSVVWLRGLKRR